jgi:hypothetical protein
MGYIEPFYPKIIILYVLCHSDNLVFYSFTWTYKYDPRGMRLLTISAIITLHFYIRISVTSNN